MLQMALSCAMPEPKKPQLSVDEEMLMSALKQSGEYEKVGVFGETTFYNSTENSSLKIVLMNPYKEPVNYEARYALARKAALLTINSIDNKTDYGYINVEFLVVKKNGVSSHGVKQKVIFTLDELKSFRRESL